MLMASLAALIIAQADAGVSIDVPTADAGVALTARDLCAQFTPPPGDHAIELDGGSVLLSPARAAFDACRIAASEKFADLSQTPCNDQHPILSTSHSVAALIVAIVSAEAAVIQSRASQGCKAVANPFAGCH